jgi:TPR repeat protein
MILSHVRTMSVSLALAGLVALATGCTSELFANPVEADGASYDAQACVENALRRSPDAESVRLAAVAFTESCRDGESAACSALGVMYELGLRFSADTNRAHDLYASACEAHNHRACSNLGGLLSREAKGSPARSNDGVALRGAP